MGAESGHTGTDGERGQKPNTQWEEPDRDRSGEVTCEPVYQQRK